MSSFISTVLFANVNLSVGALEHSPEVLLKSAPGDTVSREHVMSTVLSAGWSSARTPLKLPLGARRKPARGIIRRGDTSRANVTGGPVEKKKKNTSLSKAGIAHFENKAEINNLQKPDLDRVYNFIGYNIVPRVLSLSPSLSVQGSVGPGERGSKGYNPRASSP